MRFASEDAARAFDDALSEIFAERRSDSTAANDWCQHSEPVPGHVRPLRKGAARARRLAFCPIERVTAVTRNMAQMLGQRVDRDQRLKCLCELPVAFELHGVQARPLPGLIATPAPADDR